MNIQKEREAFEEVFPCSTGTIFNEYGHYESQINHQDAIIQNISWVVWKAAKAQAVSEGFVLVNKKDLVKVLNCVTDDWLIDTDSFEEFKKIESLVQDEVNAMIEAQEPK